MPLKQSLVSHSQLVADALGQKARQALINNIFLLGSVAVPVDHLVAEALAAAADGIADSGGADANTGSFNERFEHVAREAGLQQASVRYHRGECTI